MHPPFSFRMRRKENGPCTVQKQRRLERPNLHRKGASWGMRGHCDRCGATGRAFYRLRLGRWWVGVRTRIWRRGWKTEGGKGIAPAATLLPQLSLAKSLVEGPRHCESVRTPARQSVPRPLPNGRMVSAPTKSPGVHPVGAACGRPPSIAQAEKPGRGGAGAPRPTEERGKGRASPAPMEHFQGAFAGAACGRPPMSAQTEKTGHGGAGAPRPALRRNKEGAGQARPLRDSFRNYA